MYELIILGGGPAGMTAAVYAGRKKINTLMLTGDIGGQVNWTAGVENYMGYQFIEGAELMNKFSEQMKQFPIEVKQGQQVTKLVKIDGGFEITTAVGQAFQSKTVIVATGKKPRPLNVGGEQEYIGKGVTYCAICDGPVFAGEKIAVVGGGNSALEAANDMTALADHIYLVSITPLTGDSVLVDKVKQAANLTLYLEHEVLEIKGDKLVKSIRVRNLNTREILELQVGGVFIEIGLIPNSNPVRELLRLNQWGEIVINCSNETSIPGVFAAGDVTDVPEKQIVVASGEGAKAALQAHRYIQRLVNGPR